MSKANYVTPQGDDFTLNLAFTDSSGAVINITGYSILLTLKTDKALADGDAGVIQKSGSIVSAAGGTASVTLAHADTVNLTGTYYYKLDYIVGGVVKNFAYGVVTFTKSTTTRTS